MREKLKNILAIQELDMKMLRLMSLKKERETELKHIDSLREELHTQLSQKEKDIQELEKTIFFNEARITEIKDKIKKLEAKQSGVKKVDEFNALSQEMTSTEREKITIEQATCDLIDRKNAEEESLQKIKQSLVTTSENSAQLEKDIRANIHKINEEGKVLLAQREDLVKKADPETFKIYERLLKNKRDNVVVPIENRICSGCHIALTAQHENMVRKGERLVFCEHCSRILYWQEPTVSEEEGTTKRRRRRSAN
jgi:predicted  nucleic acid-binding Zn-ribbon protein